MFVLGSTPGAVYLLLDASPRGGIGIYHLQLPLRAGLRETGVLEAVLIARGSWAGNQESF